MRQLFAILFKTLLYALVVVVLVFLSVVIALQIPAVQTNVVREVASRLSKTMGFPINIRHVSIRWLDTVTLEGIQVKDHQQQPMITVGRLEVDYNLRNLIDSSAHQLHLDEVLLYRPDVRLIKNPKTGDTNLDEFIARIEQLTATNPPQPHSDQHTPFTISKVTVADGAFTLYDPREQLMTNRERFDYDHFTISKINANVRNLLLLGDTIALDIRRLRGIDQHSSLTIRRLDTKLLYCAKKLELGALYAHINNSIIRNYLVFNYNKPSAFGHFNSQVRMTAHFRNSRVSSKDLGYFSTYLHNLQETWQLTSDFQGTVENFTLHQTDLRFGTGSRSRLAGTLAFKGLPELNQTTVNLAFKPSDVTMADLHQYYSAEGFTRVIDKIGRAQFDARFVGAFDDFKTAGTFKTALGTVTGDLALKLADTEAKTTYTANLKTESFALGELIDRPELLQKIDGAGRITGRGTSLTKATIDLDGRFSRFGANGYDYRNLVVQGNLKQAFFNGQVSLRDTNLRFNLDGEFDLRGPRNHFDVHGTVGRADLRALQLMRDSLVISTSLDVALDGNTFDELVGQARFRNAFLSRNDRNLMIDTLFVASTIAPSGARDLMVTSDLLTAHLNGNFVPARTVSDLQQLVKEYKLYFVGDVASRSAYYKAKDLQMAPHWVTQRGGAKRELVAQQPDYSIDYSFVLNDPASLLRFVYPSAYLSPRSRLDGRFTVNHTAFLTANAQVDSARLDNYAFGPSTIDLTTSKFTNGPDVLASVIISSQRQQVGKLASTENLQIEASWEVDHIDFTSSIQQARSQNRGALNGELRFKGDAIDLTFRQSQFRVLDSDWLLNPSSLIRKVGTDYTVRNLSVSNQNQLLTLSGIVSEDSLENLRLEARNFLLGSLNSVLNTKVAGTLNGLFTLRDLYSTPIVESELTISELALQDIVVGDIRGEGTWDPASQRVNVNTRVNKDNVDVLTINGTYNPQVKANSLDLKAIFTNANLQVAESFTKGLFSGIGGLASGTVQVKGTPAYPILTGALDVKGGRLRFDYLKADLQFEDKIYFSESDITTKRLLLRDPNGNTALLRGGVYHDGFKYFQLNLEADFKNFKILNTTQRDNDLFYGTAVVTGKGELFGPINNLTIRADVTSNKGTQIFIPLDGAQTVSAEDAIPFVNRRQLASTDTVHSTTVTVANSVDLSGVKLDLNLDITPDAYCELQLDRQTGDIIKAYGAGRLAMKVDTKGDFSMTGSYDIQQGEYTFTFENVINKRFQIRPNSRITWTGDPYSALLDVTAAYTQYTSLAALSPRTTTTTTDQTHRYPVDLLIKMNGQLQSPDINFDLKIKEYPASADFRQYVTAFESRIQSNDQELTRQVSSLLLFNQLLPEGTELLNSDNIYAGAANSVSELLSNRISQLASTLDKNLDVGISLSTLGLGTVNENLVNNLQLRLSYRFLNDRFRISRDGGFTYGQNQTSAASLLGEWTLEYWIRPDGRLRAKMYNRNQQNGLGLLNNYSTTGLTTSGGISLLYTRSFNHLFGGSKRATPGLVPAPAVKSPVASPVTRLSQSN